MVFHSLAGVFTPLLAETVPGGGYVSIVKAVVLIGVLLLWSHLLAWSSEDAKAAHLPQGRFNVGNLFGMIVAFAIAFALPLSFWLVLPIMLLILGAEAAIYLYARNKVAGLADLKQQWEDWRNGLKRAKKSDSPGAIQFIAKGGPLPVPTGESPDRPAYDAMQFALTDPLRKGAEQVELLPSPEGTRVKYVVDCVGYDLPTPLDEAAGPAAITYIKSAAGLDVDEKRKPQSGGMKMTVDGEKREAKVSAAGTTAGEFIKLMIDASKRHSRKLTELGFSDSQLATVKASLKNRKGVVLLATPKGHGLTQLMYGIVRGHDAFMEHMQSIERDPPESIEGLTPNPLPANAPPEDELQKFDWVSSQDPDVILLDRMENPKTAAAAVRFAMNEEMNRRVYIGMRAGSVAEAIEQWRKMAGTEPEAMAALNLVVVGRVLRKLCAACKESYSPDPNTLRKLNMDPEKVTTLYKARETQIRDPKGNPIPCEFCKDMRFKGRTGVFEVVEITDELRAAVAADGARLGSNFKSAFRKGRNRYLQEEALTIVEAGETSVPEVLRVLKPAEEGARPAAASRPAAAAGARPPTAPGLPRPPAAPGAARPAAVAGARPAAPRPPTAKPPGAAAPAARPAVPRPAAPRPPSA